MKYKEYFYYLILLFIASLNFNMFFKPNNLVCGGTGGLAIIIHNYVSINYSLIILFINIITLILSLIFLNKKISLGIILSTFLYPLFINITNLINYNFKLNIITIFLASILSGIINAIIYKLGFSIGGINTLTQIINKYTNISLGILHFLINSIIVTLELLIFGINNFIISIIIIVINSVIINIILFKRKIR